MVIIGSINDTSRHRTPTLSLYFMKKFYFYFIKYKLKFGGLTVLINLKLSKKQSFEFEILYTNIM